MSLCVAVVPLEAFEAARMSAREAMAAAIWSALACAMMVGPTKPCVDGDEHEP